MHHPKPLKFLMPGWFSLVMGLSGLSLAWHSAAALLGEPALGVSLVVGLGAAAVLLVLAVAAWLRWLRHPEAWLEDLRHPVRHAFVAAITAALLLLATVAAAQGVPVQAWAWLWWVGSLTQFSATVWVLRRWLLGNDPATAANPTAFWQGVTPVVLIAVVGNVLAPLAASSVGASAWAMAQFGVGALLWPVVLALLLVRRAVAGPLSARLMPTWFITVAPPSVIGLVLVQQGAGVSWVSACWGVAFFFLVWAGSVAKSALNQPFALPFWALSFPLAAFASLSLKWAALVGVPVASVLALMALALVSLVILLLCLGTYKGLRDGSLLAPETVATLVPSSPAG